MKVFKIENRWKYILFIFLFFSFLSLLSFKTKTDVFTIEIDKHPYFFSLLDSSMFYENRDFKKALEFADRAKLYVDSTGAEELNLKVWNQFGRLYFKIGLMDLSSESYLKSYNYLAKVKNNKINEFIDTNIGLGAVYLFLRDYAKSEIFFKEVLTLLEKNKTENFLSYSSILNNLGIINREVGELVLAFDYLDKGIKLLLENEPNNKNLPLLYNNLGDVFVEIKNFEEALNSYNKSLEIGLKKNDLLGVAISYKNIGLLYNIKGEFSKSISFLRKSYDLSSTLGSAIVQQIASENLSMLYKEKGSNDSSLYFLEKKQEMESIINDSQAKQNLFADEIRTNYEQKQSEMKEQFDNRGKNYFFIVILSVIILLIFIFLFFSINKKYSKLSLEAIKRDLNLEKLELNRKLLLTQLEEKDKQLTTNLIYAVKRNQLLKEAVDKLVTHRKVFNKEGQEVIRGVIQDLKASQEDKIFEEFEMAFLNLHQDFFKNLLAEFPQLSLNEKRLCAFIRLNLGTKEIASITGQTLSTLNMAKVRLRKRLGLTHTEQDLYEFLTRF
jgi:tetratricopeptide (TPR) repeat protein